MTNTPNMKPAETLKTEPAVVAPGTNQPQMPVKEQSTPDVAKSTQTGSDHKSAEPVQKS